MLEILHLMKRMNLLNNDIVKTRHPRTNIQEAKASLIDSRNPVGRRIYSAPHIINLNIDYAPSQLTFNKSRI